MQTIKPADGKIFAKPLEKVTKTKSGILLDERAAEKPAMGEVINSGSKDYQSKDVIVYKEYTTTELKLDGEEYFLIDQSDVLGKVVENE